jgi:hypothetical protein
MTRFPSTAPDQRGDVEDLTGKGKRDQPRRALNFLISDMDNISCSQAASEAGGCQPPAPFCQLWR